MITGAALLVNPWGTKLLRWLVASVLWLRPQIEEWNPTPLGWDHAAFFLVLVLTAFAWAFTRRPRAWWELAACLAFALLGWRSVRNAPLFTLVALALASPHLADALARFDNYFARLKLLARHASVQKCATLFLGALAVALAAATFTLHKEHPLTMEIPRSQYPIGAVSFLESQRLHGPLLVFFDWGEMVLFHLPGCPPSLDGRLDTCYSPEIIAAHWKFYNGEPFDEKVLNPNAADFALLPVKLAGAVALSHRPGWKAIYFDDLAVILARDIQRFPSLNSAPNPVIGTKDAILGRARFPDSNPRWKSGIRK